MRLGIDIDSHAARAAFLDPQGRPHPLPLPDGETTLPALARQTMHGLLVGPAAAQRRAGNSETTLSGCTRLMGRAGSLPPPLRERLPFPVRQIDGEVVANLLYAEVPVTTVYSRLIRYLVDAARQIQPQPIEAVVLTVPASAEDRFRVQARAAATAAGVTVHRLLNQPSAALLAAPLPPTAHRVAVVHCGGGTTDVSLAARDDERFRILATTGDPLLGGDDLAWTVADQLNERFRSRNGVDVYTADRGRVAALGLRHAADRALHTLAVAPQMTLALDHGGGFGRDLATVLHRQAVDSWLEPYLARLRGLAQQTLCAANLTPVQIDAVLLTGDWTFLPALRQTVAAAFSRPVADLIYSRDAPWLPAFGAAIAAADDTQTIWDVTPYPLGINCYYDEVELFSPIIRANTPIPTPAIDQQGAHTEQYQTRKPGQTSVKLDVLQYRGGKDPNPYGRHPVRPAECEILGSWHFEGLRPRKDGFAPFTVTFAVDRDGILQLYARETGTRHTLQAQVQRGIG